jgi:spermidine/putrescine transport system permease protein
MAEQSRTKGFAIKRQPGFGIIAIFCFILLYLPIVTLVVYSFNAGTSIAIWEGFSWRWYQSAWHNDQVQEVSLRSLLIAGVAAFVSTTRTKHFPGLTFIYAFINQPLVVPEIVTGVALLIFFAMIKIHTGYTGIAYLLAAHTAFCIPFAYLPIRARLESMDLSLERAAADLYATPWKTFRHVTLPILWPGILAGAMLAFVISLDDVVITELVKSGGQDTLPTYMLGQLRRVVTPEINAISTVFLFISILTVTIFFILSRNKQ